MARSRTPARFSSAIEALFKLNAEDAAVLARDLHQRSIRAYNATVNSQLQALGHPGGFRLENRAELRRLRSQAVETARGIASTYNSELAGKVDALLAAEGRRGLNRRTLARRLSDWDRARAGPKSAQIAATEGAKIAVQAVRTFVSASRLEDVARFVLLPAESDHSDLNDEAAAAGELLRADDPALLELPAHVNERHAPVVALPVGVGLEAAWLGG